MSRDEIGFKLTREVAAATERLTATRAAFKQVNVEIPSVLPYPDGVLRIRKAGAERQAAREALMKALGRLQEFMDKGTVPPDHT